MSVGTMLAVDNKIVDSRCLVAWNPDHQRDVQVFIPNPAELFLSVLSPSPWSPSTMTVVRFQLSGSDRRTSSKKIGVRNDRFPKVLRHLQPRQS